MKDKTTKKVIQVEQEKEEYVGPDGSVSMIDKPEYGKQYSLTGGAGQPCVFNGNTWKESEVKKTDK